MHGGAVAIARRHCLRNWPALALALALHALLVLGVFHRFGPRPAERPGPAMLWVKVAPPAPLRKPASPRWAAAPRPPARPRAPASAAPLPVAPAAAPPLAEAPPVSPSADTIMSIAKRDLGKIDKELRNEFRQPALSASADSALQRLARGIEQAHEAAPNKWYQRAKIEDITPPGDDGRKVYKITTVLGTYCVRYADKNKAGFDHGQANLGEPLVGACPHMF